MSLSKLPRELVLTIGDNMPIAALSRFLRTCHSLHELLSPALTARITTEKLSSTVLRRGINLSHLPTVRLALDHDAPWHTTDHLRGCYNAFEDACEQACQGTNLDIVDAMIKHYGLTILTADEERQCRCLHFNPLTDAIRGDNLALVTLLLEAGAPPDRNVSYGSYKSPLDFAGKYGSTETAEVLIKHGACVSGRSLSYAMNSRNWNVAAVFVRAMETEWLQAFPWSRSFPLGDRTPGEIKSWLEGGKAYLEKRMEEETAWRIAEREKSLRAKEAEAVAEVDEEC